MRLQAPAWARSIRFRLTAIYSVALFLVGALVLGAIYAGLRNSLDDEPVSRRVTETQIVPISEDVSLVVRQEVQRQFVTLEQRVNERALEQLRRYSFGALGGLFVLSLGIGWIVAGRALKPIDRITAAAREITGSDLSRRIDLQGPDDELGRMAGTFDDMLGRLDRAFEGQRRFIHEASHELRNPLATIRTNLEVALADPAASADDLRQTAEVVDRSADRMTRVVDDLLAFARSEVPDRELISVDLVTLARDVCAEFTGMAEAHGVRVDFVGHPRICVVGDPDGLRRVVANLLANALEHAPSGSTVIVEVERHGGRAAVAVSDSGRGVPAADRDRVFERAWRGAASRRNRPGGSGLGLSIADEVVRSHGGTVTVQTAETGGARFVVDLPVSSDDPM